LSYDNLSWSQNWSTSSQLRCTDFMIGTWRSRLRAWRCLVCSWDLEIFPFKTRRWSGSDSLISMKFTIWTPWIPILWWSGVSKWHIFICL
jgi:hypothetical protein